MDAKKIKVRIRDNITGLQRILQIFSRRGYSIKTMQIKTGDGYKEILIEFPADFQVYRTVVEQIKKMADLVYIEHDKIDIENQELIEVENLF